MSEANWAVFALFRIQCSLVPRGGSRSDGCSPPYVEGQNLGWLVGLPVIGGAADQASNALVPMPLSTFAFGIA